MLIDMSMNGCFVAMDQGDRGDVQTWDGDRVYGRLTAGDACGVEKAWDLCVTLTSALAAPMSFYASAEPIGPDLGYGQAMWVDAAAVAAFAAKVAAADEAAVMAAFESLDTSALYPSIDWDDPEDRSLEFDCFADYQRFLAEAAADGKAILFAIT
jgi:hypothetical protein